MTEKDEKLRIAVDLKGNVRKQLLEIQKVLGIRSHTDTLRFLITDFHRNQIKKEIGE